MSRKRIIGSIVLLVALFLFLPSGAYAINWRYNLQDAFRIAKSSQKPIMVDFYTEWCGWCKKLDSDTYSDPDVKKLAEEFICVKIDGDKERGLVSKYNISGYPTILFLNYEGTVVNQVVGYEGPSDFAKTMKVVLERTKKAAPVAREPEKPKPTQEKPKPTPEKPKPTQAKPTKAKVDSEFVYNGYIESTNGEIIGQVNYAGKTYFVKKGDTFDGYKVLQIDKTTLILAGKDSQLVLELRKALKK